MSEKLDSAELRELAQVLGVTLGEPNVQERQSLARYTSLRVGGPADLLAVTRNAGELRQAVTLAWALKVPCRVLGSGANVLVSDAGIQGLVVLNRARSADFGERGVNAESGASFSTIARQSVTRGMAGLEWATGIPGTVGGAVVGNAGAWGGNVASALVEVSILKPPSSVETWPAERLEFGYRTSVLKSGTALGQPPAIVLGARFSLEAGDPEELKSRVAEIARHRKRSQPTGASCGSVFKNPPDDYAGRLIEAAGLKGYRHGGAHVSKVHANFIVNDRDATATDVRVLIDTMKREVEALSGFCLDLEIELLGAWDDYVDFDGRATPGSTEVASPERNGQRPQVQPLEQRVGGSA